MKSILYSIFSKCFLGQKKFDLIKFYKDLFLQKEMVPSPKTFDVLKYRKMTELTQTKHRFGILAGFSDNIAYQTGFENSTGNTNYRVFENY